MMTPVEDAPTWFIVACACGLALLVLAIAGAFACGIVHGTEWLLGG